MQQQQQHQDVAGLPQSQFVGVVHATIVMDLVSCNATATQHVSMALMSVDVKSSKANLDVTGEVDDAAGGLG